MHKAAKHSELPLELIGDGPTQETSNFMSQILHPKLKADSVR